MRGKLIIILSVIALSYGCSTTQNTATNKNVAGIYMPGLNLIAPQYRVFHKNDSLTELHFRLNSSNILYTKKRNDSTYSANILVHYELTEKGSETILDSASISFTDFGNNKTKKHLFGTINLATQAPKTYDLVITVNDISRDHFIRNRIVIKRTNLYNIQNYLLLDSNKNVVFEDYFNQGETLYLIKNEENITNSILLKRYGTDLPIAKPPFSVSEDGQEEQLVFKPNSIETLEFDSSNTLTYTVGEAGLYHFQYSEDNKVGPTFFHFQEHFPRIKSPENMIGPMRYISTKKEYNQLTEAENKKLAVDKFWLDIAGSSERAKTLIREYYTRVQSANHYFTSYMEGWKTDRGIIYIIFGSPNVVYKNKNYENWIYGEENNMMSISFVFNKVDNPVSGNDYQLSRSPIFKNTWFRAVDSWRSGRIY